MIKIITSHKRITSEITKKYVYPILRSTKTDLIKPQEGKVKHIYILTDKNSVKPSREIQIVKNGSNYISKTDLSEESSNLKYYQKIRLVIFKLFFPRNYPYSVENGYYHFTKYSFLCGVFIHLMNFVSTQLLINSLGLGLSKSSSLSISAGLNWVIKDGIGQIGSIFFSSRYAHKFEIQSKQWRFLSHVIITVGVILEVGCISLNNPIHFLLLASLAQTFKVSGVVGIFATRASFMTHFAKERNITDLHNKQLALSNFTMVVGNIIGVMISVYCTFSSNFVYSLIGGLSMLYIWSGYKSIEEVHLRDLSKYRAYFVCEEYLVSGHIPRYDLVNIKEGGKFFSLKGLNFCNYPIEKTIGKEKDVQYVMNLTEIFQEFKFFSYVKTRHSLIKRKITYDIYTYLRVDADNHDIFLAFMFTVKLYKSLRECGDNVINVIKQCVNFIRNVNKLELFDEMKLKGYDLHFGLLEENYMRYQMI